MLYNIINNLTGSKKKKQLPEGFTDEELADMFLEFFERKIIDAVENITETSTGPTPTSGSSEQTVALCRS